MRMFLFIFLHNNFVISKKCRTLKPQKAKVHYVPYKTSKLEVYFDVGLKLNSLAKLILEVYAWPKLVRNGTSCRTLLNKMSLGLVVTIVYYISIYSHSAESYNRIVLLIAAGSSRKRSI